MLSKSNVKIFTPIERSPLAQCCRPPLELTISTICENQDSTYKRHPKLKRSTFSRQHIPRQLPKFHNPAEKNQLEKRRCNPNIWVDLLSERARESSSKLLRMIQKPICSQFPKRPRKPFCLGFGFTAPANFIPCNFVSPHETGECHFASSFFLVDGSVSSSIKCDSKRKYTDNKGETKNLLLLLW